MTTFSNTLEFINTLRRLNIKISIAGERLSCEAPKGLMTPALKAELSERKTEIIAIFKSAATQQVSPIQSIPRQEPLPLSFSQQRLWFLDQLEEQSTVYNSNYAVQLLGNLNVEILTQSINEIINRHEVLRTTFAVVDDEPVQVIQPSKPLSIPIVDLQSYSETECTTRVQDLSHKIAHERFDLRQDYPIRVLLISLSSTVHTLLVTMHHIASDGRSMELFTHELSTIYHDFSESRPLSLFNLSIQYADFAHWQRQSLQGELLARLLDYWQQQLADAPALLHLPTDHPRPSVPSFQGKSVAFRLSAEVSQKLATLSQQSGTTLFMTLLSAFYVLLHRYSHTEDIVIGSPIDNRNHCELEPLIGFFINTLPLRVNLAGGLNFCELLKQVREVALSAYAHQDLPFEKLVEILNPERNLSYHPIFQVMFNLKNAESDAYVLPNLEFRDFQFEDTAAKFDLMLSMRETNEGLVGAFIYSCDLFDYDTIERLAGHFETLIKGIVINPEQTIDTFPLLTALERQQLLVDWNETQIDYSQDLCLHQLFETQVEKTPQTTAVVFEGQRLTYEELNQRANQLANYLQTLGIGPESMVGICLERSLEMVVGLLGILKVGAAYVPIDPTYPQDRLGFMLTDAQVPVLLTSASVAAHLPPCPGKQLCLDRDWEEISRECDLNLSPSVQAHNLAYVIYTSGSTGKPKGAMNTHRGIVNRLLWMQDQFQLSPADRILQKTPFCFDVSVWEFFWPLITGAKLVVARPEGHKDRDYLVQLIAAEQITTLHFVPSMLQIFLGANDLQHCHTLKRVICSGEALPFDLKTRFFDRLRCELHNLYGPTEAAIDVTHWQCQLDSPLQKVPIGKPVANTQLYILDAALHPLPIGMVGELHIAGVQLARGYHNRPELTAEKFIFHKDLDCRLYKTGDLCRFLPDGNIEYLGRADHQVKIRGFRIELGDIESALCQHGTIQEAVVVLREDQLGDKWLVAYVVPQDSGLGYQDLRDYLKQRLPEYMVPSAFVLLEQLPLTPNGKIARRALPAPDNSHRILETVFVAPMTPTEERLCQIWCEVLRLEQVGIHDNFFELGGHSLLATQVISRIRELFSVELSLRTLFEFPTVAGLAIALERHDVIVAQSTIPVIERDGDLPLSFAQQRLWFLDQLEGQSATYNIPQALQLLGPLDVNVLERSLNELVRRHGSLRTTFQVKAGEPGQVITPAAPVSLIEIDLQTFPESERSAQVQRRANELAATPFDISQDLPIRVALLKLSAEDHVLVIAMHHIVSDGWSMGIFIRELSILYRDFSQGRSSSLPELPIQYVDFAHWQRQHDAVFTTQLTYWQQQLAGVPTVLELPTDYPRPPVQTFQGRLVSFQLDAELSQKLQTLAQQSGTTLFVTLLSAFAVLLYRYSQVDDLVIGSPIANRNRRETEPLIGFFVNTLLLRTNLSGNPSFAKLLQQVHQTALDAYTHQDLPFEKLVEELNPERNLSHHPLFQVMFILQNATSEVLELPHIQLNPVQLERCIAKFDLTLSMRETSEGLTGGFEYNYDLFKRDSIEWLVAQFQTLLEAVVANPEQAICTVPMLTEPERRQLLFEWNQTHTEYSKDKSVHQVFEEQVTRTPEAIALVFGEQQLTYHDLNIRANQLAAHLQGLGVKPGQLVGVGLERSLDLIISLLAILKVGGAYVPLEASYPPERLAFMLEDTQLSILITTHQAAERFTSVKSQLKTICYVDTNLVTSNLTQIDNRSCGTTATDLAYVMYTSGSTGRPKGVSVLHRGIVRLVKETNYMTVESDDVFLQLAPTAFDAATLEIWGALLNGARLVLFPDALPTPEAIGSAVHHHQVSVLWLTAGLFHLMVDYSLDKLQSLRYLLAGGDVLSVDHVNRVVEQLPNCTVINGYGPTENTTFTCCYPVLSPLPTDRSVPIGRPIANTQIYILDPQRQPVPIGVPGELYIGGDGLAKDYFNRPELTQQRFVPNPFADTPGSRLYKTGDLVRYLPDGTVEFLGRLDTQVKIRGFRIELGEIAAVISQHSQVKEAIVVVREDQPGDKRLVAYGVPQDSGVGYQDLRDYLKQRLPEYMVPSAWIMLERLPLNSNGKVDRRALPAPAQQLGVESAEVPESILEIQLVNVGKQVLNYPHLSVDDNFFSVGGNSLLAVRFCAEVEKTLRCDLPVAALFQAQTIRDLARVLHSSQSVAPSALVMLKPKGTKRPLFFVNSISQAQRLVPRLDSDQPVHGLNIFGIRSLFDGRFDQLTLSEVANYLIKDVQTVQPHGPYQLAGFCQDGALTMEVAQQLRQQGELVSSVCVIDSFLQRDPTQQWQQKLYMLRWFGLQYIWLKRKNFFRSKNIQARQQETLTLEERFETLSKTQKDQIFYHYYMQFAQNYSLQSYDGHVVLLLSSEFKFADISRLREQVLAPGRLDVREVKGLHSFLFDEPYVQDVAIQLNGALLA